MASYRKRGKTWRVELYRDGRRESRSFFGEAWRLSRSASAKKHLKLTGSKPR